MDGDVKVGPEEVAAAVRRMTGDAAAEPLAWSVRPMAHVGIISTTGGLHVVDGRARTAGRDVPWSCVLKVVVRPPHEECLDPASWCYWRREAAFYGSGLATALRAGLRAPRPYGVADHDAEARIWMERVPAPERRWSLDDFHRAGRAAGRSAGAFLSGRPVPADPWLARGFLRSILADGGFWATTMHPGTGDTWRSPLAEPFGARTRERVLRLWARRDRLLAAAEALPPVFGHGDLHPRNIMLPAGVEDIVAVDWGFCGPAPLGADLGDLVYGPAWFCDVEIADLPAVEDAAFAGYHAGLAEAGWRGDPRLVRLGFAAQVAVRMAACMPGWAALMLGPERAESSEVLYRRPVAAVLEAWTALAELTLDLADEAVALAGELESAGLIHGAAR